MDIYMLLRMLIDHIQLTPDYKPEQAVLIKDAARDLISKLELTQALGSLTSDLKGHIT